MKYCSSKFWKRSIWRTIAYRLIGSPIKVLAAYCYYYYGYLNHSVILSLSFWSKEILFSDRYLILNAKCLTSYMDNSNTSFSGQVHHLKRQFHQHFMRKFFVQKCFAQFFSISIRLRIFLKKRYHQKNGRKMLMKLTIALLYESVLSSFSLLTDWLCNFLA